MQQRRPRNLWFTNMRRMRSMRITARAFARKLLKMGSHAHLTGSRRTVWRDCDLTSTHRRGVPPVKNIRHSRGIRCLRLWACRSAVLQGQKSVAIAQQGEFYR